MKIETQIPLDPPGTLLLQEFIEPMGLSQKAVAQGAGIPYVRFNELIHGKRRITGEYALRLGYFFQMEAQFWINLQADYDLRKARREYADLKKTTHTAQELMAG
ncbi:MAG: HigA family addiction module antitoxin [Opitutaceae bacterium]